MGDFPWLYFKAKGTERRFASGRRPVYKLSAQRVGVGRTLTVRDVIEMKHLLAALFLAAGASATGDYTQPKCEGKQVVVHLFEWSWDSVARECEEVLGPKGYCGVQVSPPQEHIQGSEWWTRYQPVSYILTSRSGNRDQFISMVERCNAVGVNVMADLVINHMSGHGMSGTGSGGSGFDGNSLSYPAVPFGYNDFHQPYCEIYDYNNPEEVRNCYLVSLNDLNGGTDYVRQKIADYINDLISIGVKGFRVDASKHMWPGDLEAIQDRLSDVDGERPLIYHEVIDHGTEPITMDEYTYIGKVTEFNVGSWVSCIKNNGFECYNGYPGDMLNGLSALAFVDNQRNHGGGGDVLTYKDDYYYKLATAFNLGHHYAFKRVMSSYDFTDTAAGPPGNQPGDFSQGCGNGWICEHRWSSIMNLAQFANVCSGELVANWSIQGYALGFSRGNKGFIAMGEIDGLTFQTGLPAGDYCDIIHDCEQTVTVNGDGTATVRKAQSNDPVVAICVGCTAL